jgi:hypothetical protein
VPVRYESDLGHLIGGVDALVLITSWAEYQRLPELLADVPTPPIVVDGRRSLPPNSVPRYSGIGR